MLGDVGRRSAIWADPCMARPPRHCKGTAKGGGSDVNRLHAEPKGGFPRTVIGLGLNLGNLRAFSNHQSQSVFHSICLVALYLSHVIHHHTCILQSLALHSGHQHRHIVIDSTLRPAYKHLDADDTQYRRKGIIVDKQVARNTFTGELASATVTSAPFLPPSHLLCCHPAPSPSSLAGARQPSASPVVIATRSVTCYTVRRAACVSRFDRVTLLPRL